MQGLVHTPRYQMQGKQRVAANLFDEDDQRTSQTRRRLDELAALQQVVTAAGEVIIAADLLAGLKIMHHGQIAIAGVFGHLIVDAGVLYRHA